MITRRMGPWVCMLLSALALTACNNDGGASGQASTADGATPVAQAYNNGFAGTPPVAQVSPWTTLGTRAKTSQPQMVRTDNADAVWSDYDRAQQYPKTVSLGMQYITMPDGVQLAAYVTLPADADGNAIMTGLPVLLMQTTYNGGISPLINSIDNSMGAMMGQADPYLVQRGYASVTVDIRGTGQSGGTWTAFGPVEQADYTHVVDWVATQPWSNGKVGVYGVSYLGIASMLTAAKNNPAVKAAFPIVPIGDGYRDTVFTGGQMNVLFTPLWMTVVSALGVTNPCIITDPQTCLNNAIAHVQGALTGFQMPLIMQALFGDAATAYDDPAVGSFWQARSPLEQEGNIRIPTFVVGALHDLFQRSEPLAYEILKQRVNAKLLIAPGQHIQTGMGQGLPADGIPPLNHLVLMWFDRYLKDIDNGAAELPNVTQYVAGLGHYVTSVDWPNPAAHAERLYLQGNLGLSASLPASNAKSHTFYANPLQGICSVNTSQWTFGALGLLNLPCTEDNTLAETGSLNFEMAAPDDGLYIDGPIQADLWISSTTADAQLSVRVDDVGTDNVPRQLTNGVMLASMRAVDNSRSRYLDGVMIQPWHVYTKASKSNLKVSWFKPTPTLVQVEIFPTSAFIQPGHRLRVSIGASNVAQALPSLPDLFNVLAGITTVYNDASHPSSVVLPAVPSSRLSSFL